MEDAEELIAEDERWRQLGAHVLQLRIARRLRQKDLAKKADISEYTLRTIERHVDGKGHTRKTLEKLSEAFKLGADYFYEYLQNPPDDLEASPIQLRVTNVSPSHPDLEPQSEVELMVPLIGELMAEHLNEIVVPRLANMEKQVSEIWNMIHDAGSPDRIHRVETPVHVDVKHPSEPE